MPLAALQAAAGRLSQRYRAEIQDGRAHLDDMLAVKAYLSARLPATYAAVRASLKAAALALPAFSPRSLLDFGAGPGTALWAAADCWPDLRAATLVEASAAARSVGAQLAEPTFAGVDWVDGDVTRPLPGLGQAELVTLCYVLDELSPAAIAPLVERLWTLTRGVLVIVEPGTPAGWRRVTAARAQLLEAGARLLAPCPHDAPCPLATPDWCHFSRRVARSRLHRLIKNADVPWEDEKFAYIAVARNPATQRRARVLAPPRTGSGKVSLKLCQPDGSAIERLFTRRDGAAYKATRRVDWGDTLDPERN